MDRAPNAALSEIAPRLALGVHRFKIHREPHPFDLMSYVKLSALIRKLNPDVLHGHGAKAGAFMRARGHTPGKLRVYTPHGGSLHYPLTTRKGMFYSRLERALMNRTELFLFESAFARDTFQRTIGIPKGVVRCVFNGVTPKEFAPLITADDATDVTYVGEFRHIKGADLLIDAVARLRANGRLVTLTLGGDGEEMAALKAQCERLGLTEAVRFLGHVPARTGFSKGRLLVVPSRGDSMPYVVIEAAAAGVPILAARVGGIPEILGNDHPNLVTPDNVLALVRTRLPPRSTIRLSCVTAPRRCASACRNTSRKPRWSTAFSPRTRTPSPSSKHARRLRSVYFPANQILRISG